MVENKGLARGGGGYSTEASEGKEDVNHVIHRGRRRGRGRVCGWYSVAIALPGESGKWWMG